MMARDYPYRTVWLGIACHHCQAPNTVADFYHGPPESTESRCLSCNRDTITMEEMKQVLNRCPECRAPMNEKHVECPACGAPAYEGVTA